MVELGRRKYYFSMAKFVFEARDRAGNMRKGTLEARSQRHAVKDLQAEGYTILKIYDECDAPSEPLHPLVLAGGGALVVIIALVIYSLVH